MLSNIFRAISRSNFRFVRPALLLTFLPRSANSHLNAFFNQVPLQFRDYAQHREYHLFPTGVLVSTDSDSETKSTGGWPNSSRAWQMGSVTFADTVDGSKSVEFHFLAPSGSCTNSATSREQIAGRVVYHAGGNMAAILRTRKIFGKVKADMNITPLIDVLLVLIVIFMVISPLTPHGLETNVPQTSPQGSPKPLNETLVLSLSQSGGIRLNQEEIESAALGSRLQDVLRTRSDRTLFVQADDDVFYNDVAHLIDTARGAGADRIGLMSRRIADH
jgi:biopolymer transport protein TolR